MSWRSEAVLIASVALLLTRAAGTPAVGGDHPGGLELQGSYRRRSGRTSDVHDVAPGASLSFASNPVLGEKLR